MEVHIVVLIRRGHLIQWPPDVAVSQKWEFIFGRGLSASMHAVVAAAEREKCVFEKQLLSLPDQLIAAAEVEQLPPQPPPLECAASGMVLTQPLLHWLAFEGCWIYSQYGAGL
jgi:hypothetical protein